MRFNSITAAACLVVATSALNSSPEAIFGYSNIEARADNNTVYVPTQTLCGMGDTCAQACGASFDMCPSNDESIHCFDKQNQKCCPGGKGGKLLLLLGSTILGVLDVGSHHALYNQTYIYSP